jgi:putative two-component system response regulator
MISEDKILQAKILIVDDEPMSIRLLGKILAKAGYANVTPVTDSRQVLPLYQKIQPDLLILDLCMPHLDGFGVMDQLRSLTGDVYLPIIVISSEEHPERKHKALKSGAKDFLNKPYDQMEVLIRIRNIIEVRLLYNQTKADNVHLEQKVVERTQELFATEIDFIQRLAHAVEFRDIETGIHVVRMSEYVRLLASQIGLDQDRCNLIHNACPLHDIGKVGIPDHILTKPGKLTAEEWNIMKKHTLIGGEILAKSSSMYLNAGRIIALTHHEKWDGSGYPQGLKEKTIPLEGRICCLCDVFDALLSQRPYKRAWTLDEAVAEIQKCKSTHFDPYLVDQFMAILPQIKLIAEKYNNFE